MLLEHPPRLGRLTGISGPRVQPPSFSQATAHIRSCFPTPPSPYSLHAALFHQDNGLPVRLCKRMQAGEQPRGAAPCPPPARPRLPRIPRAAILLEDEPCKQSWELGSDLTEDVCRLPALLSPQASTTVQTEHDCLLSGFIDSGPASRAGGLAATASLLRLALPQRHRGLYLFHFRPSKSRTSS